MTLDEAIKHCEEVAEEKDKSVELYRAVKATEGLITKCENCAKEHRQLAEWLKELKAYRQAIENIKSEIREAFEDYDYEENDVSEYQSIGNINDIIAIIDKHIGRKGKE